MYDYKMHLKSDILHYLFTNYDRFRNMPRLTAEDALIDELWDKDEVSGNGDSGYPFIREESAKVAVSDNAELLADAMEYFALADTEFVKRFTKKGYLFLDSMIRLYLLATCVSAALNEIQWFDTSEN